MNEEFRDLLYKVIHILAIYWFVSDLIGTLQIFIMVIAGINMAMANENESILKNDFDGIRNELDELKRYLAKIEEENKQKEMDSEETAQPIVDTESAQQSGESQPTEEAEDSENLEENDNSENIDEEYQEAEEMEIREGE